MCYSKLILFLLVLFIGCQQQDEPTTDCDGSSLSEKTWFQDLIGNRDDFTDFYRWVMLGNYIGKRVVILGNCCPQCNSVVVVYDCEGNSLGLLGNGSEDIRLDDISDLTTLLHGSECMFD